MELLASLDPAQMYLLIWGLALGVGSLLVVTLKRSWFGFMLGLSVASGVLMVGCFGAAVYVLAHATDVRWLPPDYTGMSPPDLSRVRDVPFLGDLATHIERLFAQGIQNAQSVQAVRYAGQIAGDFAINGLKALVAFLGLGLTSGVWYRRRLARRLRLAREQEARRQAAIDETLRSQTQRIEQLESELNQLKGRREKR